MGDWEKEVQDIQDQTGLNVTYMENPNFENYYFDVMFFDYGGMSMGNSMLESFCRRILKHAEDHPQKFYVMTSTFTAYAMNDLILELGSDTPTNIIPSITLFLKWK